MPLLWSYAKPPPDKEAGPTPRRFIRHSAKTKKAVPAYWHGTARIFSLLLSVVVSEPE